MDLSVWYWRNPWEKRTYLFCSLIYFYLLLQQDVLAAESGYSQETKNEIPESNKLDSLNNYLPYDSREDSDYKRGSAFFPLRGKKPFPDDSIETHQLFMPDQDDVEDKRSQFFPLRGKKVPDDLKRASYFMPMRGRKDGGWTDEDYDITDESPNKRASSFMPMRGKKKYAAISDYLTKAGTYSNDVSEVLNPSNDLNYQTADKRIHSFVPVRGKRSYKESESLDSQISVTTDSSDDETSNHSARKRSVSSMPMTESRETDDYSGIAPGGIVTSLLEKDKHSFMPMKERRDSDYDDNSGSIDKKSAFMPMRGRRFFSDEEISNDESVFKRAQHFMPMRGRRTHLPDVVHEGPGMPVVESKLTEDKRASSFMPMRGRRAILEDSNEMNSEKRTSSFTPMRGRRTTDYHEGDNVFYSPSLNKRVTFMPIHERQYIDEDFEVEPWPVEQLISLLDKKSSAFMPMRGRRLVNENFTVEPWPAEQLMSLLDKKTAFMPMRGRRGDSGDTKEDVTDNDSIDKRSSYFMPMRGRRMDISDKFYNPYPYLMAGIGSSLMSKPYSDQGMSYNSIRSAHSRRKKLRINWDAVKRAFHASRGKRFEKTNDILRPSKDSYAPEPKISPERSKSNSNEEIREKERAKRSVVRPRVALQPNRQYLALKRPMSFFATRGKRLDNSGIDKLSKLR